jgi:hypothetical protein
VVVLLVMKVLQNQVPIRDSSRKIVVLSAFLPLVFLFSRLLILIYTSVETLL